MSDPSAVAEAAPKDTFPPTPPRGLTAIYAAGAVELVWTANTEADLAGYNVYRADGGAAQRINKDLLRTPIYRDTTAPAGRTFTYSVTAVDLSGNESRASSSETVETQ